MKSKVDLEQGDHVWIIYFDFKKLLKMEMANQIHLLFIDLMKAYDVLTTKLQN